MLLDDFLPTFDFNEVHTIQVHAPSSQVFSALKVLTPAEISLLRILFAIRSLPARLTGKAERNIENARPLLQQLLGNGFILLAESPDQELVLGTIGQFWKLTGNVPTRIADASGFLAFSQPEYAKAAMNFYLEEMSGVQRVRVRTETRILVPDPATRKKFARYWLIIYPGSALIRRMWLQAIKRRAEQGPE